MFSRLFRFKNLIYIMISILLMSIAYPSVENVSFESSSSIFPWDFENDNTFYQEILISDFKDSNSLKNSMIDLADKENISIFFRDYQENENSNFIYYYLSDQKFLDQLQISENLSIKDFNSKDIPISNNDKKNSIDMLSSKRYQMFISSFKIIIKKIFKVSY